jgi:hypothetical protein
MRVDARYRGLGFLALFSVVQLATVTPIKADQTQAPASSTGPAPLCAAAADPLYGWSQTQPIQVGGTPLVGASRQRRYLDSLRGPEGQPIQYKRRGSMFGPDQNTMLDAYEVTYEGLEQPAILYLDFYHFTEPRLPKGFTCGQAFNLGLPPPDVMIARPQLTAVAVAEGKVIPPVALAPIELATPATTVVIFDYFRLIARAAQGRVVTGPPLDAKQLPSHLRQPRTVVVAYPVTCEDRKIAPSAITLVNARGGPVPTTLPDSGDQFALLMPGVTPPPDSIAAVFALEGPPPGLSIKISYREPVCPDAALDMTWPIAMTPARLIDRPPATRPAGDSSGLEWIAVQAVIDHAGNFREGIALGGPESLTKPALEALSAWRAEPGRINGAPIAMPVVVQVGFRNAKN